MLWEPYGQEIEAEGEDKPGKPIELATFQNDGVFRARRFLGEKHGVLIADEVGLGKTFIAGELIRQTVQDRRQKALVIAPAYLRDGMWSKKSDKWNIHFGIVSYEELRNDRQLGGTQDVLTISKDEYQLVVVDEGHAFRNPSTDRARALRLLLQGEPQRCGLHDRYPRQQLSVGSVQPADLLHQE
jgi:SNF2 family DNA or RNA helicase